MKNWTNTMSRPIKNTSDRENPKFKDPFQIRKVGGLPNYRSEFIHRYIEDITNRNESRFLEEVVRNS